MPVMVKVFLKWGNEVLLLMAIEEIPYVFHNLNDHCMYNLRTYWEELADKACLCTDNGTVLHCCAEYYIAKAWTADQVEALKLLCSVLSLINNNGTGYISYKIITQIPGF
jgi:hypothetical protein